MPRKKILLIGSGVVSVFAVAVLVVARIPGEDIEIDRDVEEVVATADAATTGEDVEVVKSPITGAACPNGATEAHRPIAVMLAGDDHVRPLSGIGQAELVIEMPVVTWGINRMMAVFSCSIDVEIGSIRSSRDDFIPLAGAFRAIYGHWGGSYLALQELARGVIENIDALQNPFAVYYRKPGILAPDNGFTTLAALRETSELLGYALEAPEPLFLHAEAGELGGEGVPATEVTIGYPGGFQADWKYNEEKQQYARSRGGRPEVDATDGAQVFSGTIVTMRTRVAQTFGEYNDVRVHGSGEAVIYRYGRAVTGTWMKEEGYKEPIRFEDDAGEPIAFAPGPVWIEVIQNDTPVTTLPEIAKNDGEKI